MKGCRGILAKLKLCSQNLNTLTYYMSLEVAVHMLATSSAQSLPRVILVEDLRKPSGTLDMVQINQVRAGPSWIDSIMQFLKEDILPEEKIETDKIRRKATSYWLSKDHKLYKCSFLGHYLLCVDLE